MNGKKADRAKPKDNLTMLLLPSVLGIFICLVSMFGTTWAWFTASVELPGQKIASANYAVAVVSVKNGDAEVTAANGSYFLSAGTTYTIELTASGTAQKCGGYCLIECSGTKYYTQTFNPNDTITIPLCPAVEGNYTFTGVWGSLPANIDSKDILHTT